MIGLIQVGTQAMADRYTYLPLIGVFLIVAWTAGLLVERKRMAPVCSTRRADTSLRSGHRGETVVVSGICSTMLLLAALATSRQLPVWQDSLTLNRHAIAVGRTGPKIHYNLGLALSKLGRCEEALVHFEDAIRLRPDHAKAHNNLGLCLHVLGRDDEAIASYKCAIELEPEMELAYINLSEALVALGRIDEGIAARQEALRLDPNDATNLSNLGALLGSVGRLEEAIDHFRRSLAIRPESADTRRNLERALQLREP
jgi:tetratricopeptide (TPR) repeat protein